MPESDKNESQILSDEEKSYQEEQYVFKVTGICWKRLPIVFFNFEKRC